MIALRLRRRRTGLFRLEGLRIIGPTSLQGRTGGGGRPYLRQRAWTAKTVGKAEPLTSVARQPSSGAVPASRESKGFDASAKTRPPPLSKPPAVTCVPLGHGADSVFV